jgi:pyruvate formate lyase activating enzyme
LGREVHERVVPAALFTNAGGVLRCTACAHRCVFDGVRIGACGVRHARDGQLLAPHGYVARRYVRDVETNTVYHVMPGAKALTFGMYGCDLRCPYCHNARLSQALRDGDSDEVPVPMTATALVDEAIAAGCEVLCAAYNEPMIAAEWVRDVFAEAKARGLVTVIVSDGHTTPEALAYVRPVTDVYRVDLKAAHAEPYRALGGRIEPVLDAIQTAHALGFWIEVVTLVVPRFNDSERELREIAAWLGAIDPNIPWHLNAFQPRYRMADRPPPATGHLVSIAGAAYARGLRYVYVGNTGFDELAHTRCGACSELAIRRHDDRVVERRLGPDGHCSCGERIPGVWSSGSPRT